ncbi:hypothetical protein OQH61_07085 [Helicobacter sp. MIT 21-1697]|uniref:hypothetical protein n=1 Tax=Helicobacter sp. MIT 21-1697 TaxID=2993733 RepID=UPI00224B9ABE|nr:hypothetical protein [Helicobacter sp. MIT 21-1697]MCX2717493.1 hypothetical protein [Helicobacter sp. MIT 21-1697]
MIIIGHCAIAYQEFSKITSISDISHTDASHIVWFDTNELLQEQAFALGKHCYEYKVNYAVIIHSLEELLIYANLMPQYLILHKDMQSQAKAFQGIIEHYLLDCKLLCVIKSSAHLPKIAQLGIDGAIFKQVLDNIKPS